MGHQSLCAGCGPLIVKHWMVSDKTHIIHQPLFVKCLIQLDKDFHSAIIAFN